MTSEWPSTTHEALSLSGKKNEKIYLYDIFQEESGFAQHTEFALIRLLKAASKLFAWALKPLTCLPRPTYWPQKTLSAKKIFKTNLFRSQTSSFAAHLHASNSRRVRTTCACGSVRCIGGNSGSCGYDSCKLVIIALCPLSHYTLSCCVIVISFHWIYFSLLLLAMCCFFFFVYSTVVHWPQVVVSCSRWVVEILTYSTRSLNFCFSEVFCWCSFSDFTGCCFCFPYACCCDFSMQSHCVHEHELVCDRIQC